MVILIYSKAIQLKMMKYLGVDGQEYNISSDHRDAVQAVLFLREIRGCRGRERKEHIMQKLAVDPFVPKVTELKNCTIVSEESKIDELKTVYARL